MREKETKRENLELEEEDIDHYEPPMSKVRAAIIVSGIVLFSVGLGLFIWWWLASGDDDVIGTEPLSDEETEEVIEITESFIHGIGNFGIQEFNVEQGTFRYQIEFDHEEKLRSEAYLEVRDYIHDLSDVSFSDNRISNWDPEEDDLRERFEAFEILEDSIEVGEPSNASMAEIGNNRIRTVSVDVSWQATERSWRASAADTSWDGSYEISERSIDESATLRFAETPDGWEIYSVDGIDEIRTTVLWRDPTLTNIPTNQLEEVGSTEALWDVVDEEEARQRVEEGSEYFDPEDYIEEESNEEGLIETD